MDFARRNVAVFFVVLSAICVLLPRNGLSKDERTGLYAGPLSVVVETLVEKAKPDSQDVSEESGGAQQRYRGETGISKKRTTEPESKSPLSSPSTPGNQ